MAARRRAGLPVTDLVSANPQEHGFLFPQELLAEAFAEALPTARFYSPDARGQAPARAAVARWHGGGATEHGVLLTPGTSVAYFYLFRLLGRPGDDILCPEPTYPLFEDLATLAGLRVRRYHLRREAGSGRWGIDPEEVAFQCTPRTCAVVVVSPHNPTGSVASAEELAALAAVANARGLPILFDEVFRDHLHRGSHSRPSEHGADLCLTMNGLSKRFSLPGLKAGWIVAEGVAERRAPVLHALEYLSDCLLPVSELVQAALPRLLHDGEPVARRFAALWQERVRGARGALIARGIPVQDPEGGPYLLLDLPRGDDPQATAQALLERHGIVVHPGGFYGLPDAALVTTATLPQPWPLEGLAGAWTDPPAEVS